MKLKEKCKSLFTYIIYVRNTGNVYEAIEVMKIKYIIRGIASIDIWQLISNSVTNQINSFYFLG
ncbi:hypothetical protein BW895_18940 [Bacillus cereus]|nr:hypothetical protein BW895_18940 [Bacillus cereus]OXL91152.1 hypothetical protein B9T53_29795 [Bacillus sp. KbaL1]OXL93233.1 hypothetical protein B6N65_24930 [Bacillus sp. KbaB1]BAL21443.1 hypothetical protein BCN_P235 [Bacillus cereus NC7401]PCC76083.1 hypothetical protein CNQ76_29965 [Bacillus cereus]